MTRSRIAVILALAVFIAIALHHQRKPLPEGISIVAPERVLEEPRLLIDHTWHGPDGLPRIEHEIFDEILRLVAQAQKLIVVDMFLFNASGGGNGFRPLSQELTDALIRRQRDLPGIRILVITDPFNTQYGGLHSPELERLRTAGIPVLETPLTPLRDSNPLWSTLWRVCCQWFGNSPDSGWLPSLLSEQKVTLRSYLTLLNFKANHRKVLIVDEGLRWRGVVGSGNPHDGSSRHSNIALSFAGPAALDLLGSEQAVAELTGLEPWAPPELRQGTALLSTRALNAGAPADTGTVLGRIVTEGKIRDAALVMIDSGSAGDQLDIAMFYLSHRDTVKALIAAHRRGVSVRVLLDPNRDAFGREKDGVPNRPVARDLHRADIPVRWINTHGEQFHSKAMMKHGRNGQWQLLLGSANFTRRNLDDYNLETGVLLGADQATPISRHFIAYFERVWRGNQASAAPLSLDYQAWQDESFIKYWRYRLMEASGLSTF